MKDIIIIGSGFSSLSTACYLAKAGNNVTILEKNSTVGGRARQFKQSGFTFDMGPTWYWMPDVFERFFSDFGQETINYYELVKLNPAYQIFYGVGDTIKISSDINEIYELFEKEEKGSSIHLKNFLKQAKDNYNVAVRDLVYRPGVSPIELITPKTVTKLNQLFFDIRKQIQKKFSNPRLIIFFFKLLPKTYSIER